RLRVGAAGDAGARRAGGPGPACGFARSRWGAVAGELVAGAVGWWACRGPVGWWACRGPVGWWACRGPAATAVGGATTAPAPARRLVGALLGASATAPPGRL